MDAATATLDVTADDEADLPPEQPSPGGAGKALKEALLQRPGAAAGKDRDRDLVCYVGRHGVATIPDVMKAMGVGGTVAYDRTAVCVEAGLLERLEILRWEPTLLRATREGLRYVGLGLGPTARLERSPRVCARSPGVQLARC